MDGKADIARPLVFPVLELMQCHCCHILLIKGTHKASVAGEIDVKYKNDIVLVIEVIIRKQKM